MTNFTDRLDALPEWPKTGAPHFRSSVGAIHLETILLKSYLALAVELLGEVAQGCSEIALLRDDTRALVGKVKGELT